MSEDIFDFRLGIFDGRSGTVNSPSLQHCNAEFCSAVSQSSTLEANEFFVANGVGAPCRLDGNGTAEGHSALLKIANRNL